MNALKIAAIGAEVAVLGATASVAWGLVAGAGNVAVVAPVIVAATAIEATRLPLVMRATKLGAGGAMGALVLAAMISAVTAETMSLGFEVCSMLGRSGCRSRRQSSTKRKLRWTPPRPAQSNATRRSVNSPPRSPQRKSTARKIVERERAASPVHRLAATIFRVDVGGLPISDYEAVRYLIRRRKRLIIHRDVPAPVQFQDRIVVKWVPFDPHTGLRIKPDGELGEVVSPAWQQKS
jgi:hypothetical protein